MYLFITVETINTYLLADDLDIRQYKERNMKQVGDLKRKQQNG